jgi:hypothetical protein
VRDVGDAGSAMKRGLTATPDVVAAAAAVVAVPDWEIKSAWKWFYYSWISWVVESPKSGLIIVELTTMLIVDLWLRNHFSLQTKCCVRNNTIFELELKIWWFLWTFYLPSLTIIKRSKISSFA